MFGKKLRELRKSRRLTQSELGEKLGISASTVGMYEQSRRSPDAQIFERITEFFGVSSDYMLGKEQADVGVFLDDFKARINADGALMFNGVPLSPEDAQKVLQAMEIGAKIVLEKK